MARSLTLQRIGLASIDLPLFAIAYALAFFLRFDRVIPGAHVAQYWLFLALLPLVRFVCSLAWGLHRHVWRYVGIRELVSLALATLTGSACFALLLYLTAQGSFPRTVVIIEGLCAFILQGGARLLLRLRHEASGGGAGPGGATRVLIVGAGDAGEMLVRDIRRHPERGLVPVGFLDDSPALQGVRIHGAEVLGTTADLEAIARRLEVGLVVLAMPSVPLGVQRDLIRKASRTDARVQWLPDLHARVSGEVDLRMLRDIQLEDLLGRDPVHVDPQWLRYLDGAVVLVTGAGGSIGSELARQVASRGPRRLILLDHHENGVYAIERELRELHPGLELVPAIVDLRMAHDVEALLERQAPEVVLHAAAFKHVPLMESHVLEAVHNNVLGTRHLAEAADRTGVRVFVLISTDKAVNPTSVMGRTKRLAELLVQELAGRSSTRFVAVRFGNVLGSSGSVVPLFQEQIARGGPVTVTHPDMTRYFMTIPEAVTLVLQAGMLGRSGEVLLIDMGQPVRILDLARNMIKLSGLREQDIAITFSGPRPGEKLFEELLVTSEESRRTEHPQVFAARSARPPDPASWQQHLARLVAALERRDPPEVRDLLEAVIASDRPQPAPESVKEAAPHD
jgi:FlaA1/EpsC-like NDP-sugar epimerase